jgi:hypothetical protein
MSQVSLHTGTDCRLAGLCHQLQQHVPCIHRQPDTALLHCVASRDVQHNTLFCKTHPAILDVSAAHLLNCDLCCLGVRLKAYFVPLTADQDQDGSKALK